mmetsp:Transcript_94905/g.238031  ORF Transcript_94905/g.238031 Transcript_94905/m.238031 type:complete len:271 (-) Transcript_94905:943-1755(-)
MLDDDVVRDHDALRTMQHASAVEEVHAAVVALNLERAHEARDPHRGGLALVHELHPQRHDALLAADRTEPLCLSRHGAETLIVDLLVRDGVQHVAHQLDGCDWKDVDDAEGSPPPHPAESVDPVVLLQSPVDRAVSRDHHSADVIGHWADPCPLCEDLHRGELLLEYRPRILIFAREMPRCVHDPVCRKDRVNDQFLIDGLPPSARGVHRSQWLPVQEIVLRPHHVHHLVHDPRVPRGRARRRSHCHGEHLLVLVDHDAKTARCALDFQR